MENTSTSHDPTIVTDDAPLTASIMRRLLRQQVYFAVLVAAVIWFLFAARHVIPLFIFSFLLAYILGPIVGLLTGDASKRRGISRTAAILAVYAVLIVVLSGAAWLITGRVVSEIHTLSTNFPTLRADLINRVHESERTFPFNRIPDSVRISIDNTINNLDDVIGNEVNKLAPSAVQRVPGLLELLVIPIVAYYLLKDGSEFVRVPRGLMREENRSRYDALVRDVNSSLQGYLKGQLTLSLVAAVAVFVLLTAFRVHYAYLVAILAFFLELIPVVGPIIWAATAVVLTYLQEPQFAIFVLILVVLAHQIDMHIIGPKILGGHLRLHPVVVIAALVCGTAIFGLLGALLAAPAAALLTIIVKYILVEGPLSSSAILLSGAGAPRSRSGPLPPPSVTARPERPGRRGRRFIRR
jgi:predicted PurR-regulated permease PerM